MTEDDEPRLETPLLGTPPLDRLGVAELEAYIEGLRREVMRAEAEITRKKSLRDAAASLFKT